MESCSSQMVRDSKNVNCAIVYVVRVGYGPVKACKLLVNRGSVSLGEGCWWALPFPCVAAAVHGQMTVLEVRSCGELHGMVLLAVFHQRAGQRAVAVNSRTHRFPHGGLVGAAGWRGRGVRPFLGWKDRLQGGLFLHAGCHRPPARLLASRVWCK